MQIVTLQRHGTLERSTMYSHAERRNHLIDYLFKVAKYHEQSVSGMVNA